MQGRFRGARLPFCSPLPLIFTSRKTRSICVYAVRGEGSKRGASFPFYSPWRFVGFMQSSSPKFSKKNEKKFHSPNFVQAF